LIAPLLALALVAAPDPSVAEEPEAPAEPGAVRFEGAVHLRATALRNQPGDAVLFDPGARTFALDGYLTGQGAERWGSTLVELRLEGRHQDGALRWTVAADTGELRLRSAPAPVQVCFSSTSPTGLDLAGRAGCRPLPGVFTLPSTAPAPSRLTANGRPAGEEVRATLLLREANLAWTFGRAGFATLRAGRARQVVADGLVHDDFASGLDLALDLGALGPPFEVHLALFQPTRDWPRLSGGASPMLVLRADWLPSLFEHAGLFAAVHRDATGSVAELFRQARLEDVVVRLSGLAEGTPAYQSAAEAATRTLSSTAAPKAQLAWAGLSASLLPLPGHRLTLVAALQGGSLSRLGTSLAGQPLPDVPLHGRALEVRWGWSPSDGLTVTPWLLYLSGDRPYTEKARLGLPISYDGFLGVTPYLTATNLFFGGGLSEGFAAPQATAPGVSGRGVVAPGLSLEAALPGEVDLGARGAWLRAEDAGPYGGKVYGTEVDLTARWAPRRWLSLGLEGDLLLPGDFFGGDRPVSKVIMAVDLLTP
jgi:hypothetical protein